MKKNLLFGAAMLAMSVAANAAAPAIAPIPGVKNIIIVINDGGGPTVYDATRMYLGHPLVTDGAGFAKTFVSTYPLREDGVPNSVYSTEPTIVGGVIQNNNFPIGNVQQAAVVYDSAKFWDTTPVAGASKATGYSSYPAGFKGYEWSRFAHPDSGNVTRNGLAVCSPETRLYTRTHMS
jgi:alkaline phosphatase